MIIGRGLIAKEFKDVDIDNVIFFASGVSNSSETCKSQFLREQNLVEQTLRDFPNHVFIYFSTCSIYDSSKYNSLYVLHKLHMEEIIKEKSSQYLILRISNAVGNGGNPNLLMNYLANNISNQKLFTVHKNATRNIIDVEDVKNITLQYLNKEKFNKIVNVAYLENFFINEIVEGFEQFFNVTAQRKIMDLGEHYSIDIRELDYEFEFSNKMEYLKQLIKKYYD